jgi:hypothetical protein
MPYSRTAEQGSSRKPGFLVWNFADTKFPLLNILRAQREDRGVKRLGPLFEMAN